jgi:hypothetical protein
MNYFLSYNNAEPLFVGGHAHGTKRRVPEAWGRYIQVPLPREYPPRFYRSGDIGDPFFKTEMYRQEWFLAAGRRFRLMIHESLPTHAALMLMMSTVGEHPDLVKRVRELEEENRALKSLLKHVRAGKGGF